jgi:hypothetical protein
MVRQSAPIINVMDAPALPPVEIPSPFKADKIIGVFMMVVAVISALVGVLAFYLESMFSFDRDAMDKAMQTPSPAGGMQIVKGGRVQPDVFPTDHVTSPITILGWVVIGIAVLQLAGGIGVFRGSRNGLVFGLVVAALGVLGGPFGMAIGVGAGLYAILRLWGNVGPKPA